MLFDLDCDQTRSSYNHPLFPGGATSPEFKNRWFEVKNTLGFELPNLPYLIDGDVRITQSAAIIKYLARKAEVLLGIADNASPAEHARLEMIQDHVNDLRYVLELIRDWRTPSSRHRFPVPRKRIA